MENKREWGMRSFFLILILANALAVSCNERELVAPPGALGDPTEPLTTQNHEDLLLIENFNYPASESDWPSWLKLSQWLYTDTLRLVSRPIRASEGDYLISSRVNTSPEKLLEYFRSCVPISFVPLVDRKFEKEHTTRYEFLVKRHSDDLTVLFEVETVPSSNYPSVVIGVSMDPDDIWEDLVK